MESLTIEECATLFGTSSAEVSEIWDDAVRGHDLTFQSLSLEENNEAILSVLQILEKDLSVSGPQRQGQWQTGWNENLQDFIESNYSLEALTPKYYSVGRNIVVRYRGRFIRPNSGEKFLLSFFNILRAWVTKRFLSDAKEIYEFGCGPGHNLIALSELLPGRSFVGLDWAHASQEILALVAKHHNLKVKGERFDMFSSEQSLTVQKDSVVLSIGALEQLGSKFSNFLDYLISQKVKRVVHLEPVYEMYDQSNLLGYLGAKYAAKRNYLNGYLEALKDREKKGDLRLQHCQRLEVGNNFHDGWNIIVWGIS